MRCFIVYAFWMFASLPAWAQDKYNVEVAKEIVILQSTKSYAAALKTAQEAARHLGQTLDLESNHPNKELGLSETKADCAGDGYDYPCYVARGEGDAGNTDFISVEYSNAYEGFAKGYYIVVAAIGDPGSAITRTALAKAKKWYKDAYAKQTHVWFGCMH